MCLRDPNKHTLNKMSRCVCGYCIVEIMVAAWNTRDRYLASTLSQAAIIKVVKTFYRLCFYRLSGFPLHYPALREGVYSCYNRGMLRGSDGRIALAVHSI